MSPRAIEIPQLLHLSAGCMDNVTPLLEDAGFDLTRVCVTSGSGPSAEFGDRVSAGMEEAGFRAERVDGLSGQLEQAADLASRVIAEGITLLIAVGGGRVIDTTKLAAARTNTPFVTVPTTISHDGISSPVASLNPRGAGRKSYAATVPSGIVIDVAVIGSAPPETLRSGVGDLTSNLTALLDWERAQVRGLERFDAFSAMIAENAARPVLDIDDLTQPETHQIVAKGLLMSGLAMAAAGTSRPCSGAEHLISHSLDQMLGDRARLHGEQVALGCLVAAAAHESSLLDQLRPFFAHLQLPTTPADLGITEDELVEAISRAPGTRPDRYTILSELGENQGDIRALLDRAFAIPT